MFHRLTVVLFCLEVALELLVCVDQTLAVVTLMLIQSIELTLHRCQVLLELSVISLKLLDYFVPRDEFLSLLEGLIISEQQLFGKLFVGLVLGCQLSLCFDQSIDEFDHLFNRHVGLYALLPAFLVNLCIRAGLYSCVAVLSGHLLIVGWLFHQQPIYPGW